MASAATRGTALAAAITAADSVIARLREVMPRLSYRTAPISSPATIVSIQPRIEPLTERPEWLPLVAAWIYEQWWTDSDETPDSLGAKLRAHLTPDCLPLTLVASLEHHPVGTVTLLEHDVGTELWPHLSPWLAALYVVPPFRRRGVGTALVKAAEARATTLGAGVLYLLTSDREAFYARLGWQIADRVDGQVVMASRAE